MSAQGPKMTQRNLYDVLWGTELLSTTRSNLPLVQLELGYCPVLSDQHYSIQPEGYCTISATGSLLGKEVVDGIT